MAVQHKAPMEIQGSLLEQLNGIVQQEQDAEKILVVLWQIIDEGALMSISLILSRLAQLGDIFNPSLVREHYPLSLTGNFPNDSGRHFKFGRTRRTSTH